MFDIPCAKALTDEGCQRAADGVDRNVEQVGDSAAQSVGGHGDGAVVDNRFVHQHEAESGEELADGCGNGDAHDFTEGSHGQRIFAEGDGGHVMLAVFVELVDYHRNKQEFGERGCQRSTQNAQIQTENENRVKDDVQHRGDGVESYTAFAVAVCLMNGMEQGKHEHTDEVKGNASQIGTAVLENIGRGVQPLQNDVRAEEQYESHGKTGDNGHQQQVSGGFIGFFVVSGADGLGNQRKCRRRKTCREGYRTGGDRSHQGYRTNLQLADLSHEEGIDNAVQRVHQIQEHQRKRHLHQVFCNVFVQ